ncbi:MAG: hypothetical protein GY853_01820 [PVC group bacterium]|nr:hypothetical protein [PVC group bacterium]
MNLPQNKDGKFFLLNSEGKEVEFNHAIDVQEALFGVIGKDIDYKPEHFLPEDFDMKVKIGKNVPDSREDIINKKIKKRGRPPKNKEEVIAKEEEKTEKGND